MIQSIAGRAKDLASRIENFNKAANKVAKESSAGPSPAKKGYGLVGDEPATKSDIGRLERAIQSLIPVLEQTSRDSHNAER